MPGLKVITADQGGQFVEIFEKCANNLTQRGAMADECRRRWRARPPQP